MVTKKERWQKLAYYRELAALAYKHRAISETSIVPTLLSFNHIKNAIKAQRQALREDEELNFRAQIRANTINIISRILHTAPAGTRNLEWRYGQEPSLGRVHNITPRISYDLTIGYMWYHKVGKPIYKDTTERSGLENRLVLQADQVRVNNDLIRVYEVKIADILSASIRNSQRWEVVPTDMTTGYIAITKNSRKAFYAMDAPSAIRRALSAISDEFDAALGKGYADE